MAGSDLGMSPDGSSPVSPAAPAAAGGSVTGAPAPAAGGPVTGAPGTGAARVGPAIFVRLKLRLIAGNLRGDTTRLLGFIFTMLAAIVVASFGFLAMAALRLAPADVAADVAIVTFTAVLVGWAIVPLLAFGLDDTLDPSRLALLPLRTGQLAAACSPPPSPASGPSPP
nr:hypothetical protein GCM10020093_091620 [Planobispora longispora]